MASRQTQAEGLIGPHATITSSVGVNMEALLANNVAPKTPGAKSKSGGKKKSKTARKPTTTPPPSTKRGTTPKAPRAKPGQSKLELAFWEAWESVGDHGQLDPMREFMFANLEESGGLYDRKWRADFAWPDKKVMVEIEGGTRGRPVRCHQCKKVVRATRGDGSAGGVIMVGGGHNRGEAFQNGIVKYRTAQLLGWMVLQFTTICMENPDACVEVVNRALQGRPKVPRSVAPDRLY